MSVFSHKEFDQHEEVVFFNDSASGLRAIVAIHNSVLGPALGGCRMYPYESDEAALNDVLRLSKGMSYKSAISNLPLGGGKSVIIADPYRDKSTKMFEAFGRCLNMLNGRYIVAEDSGTTVQDIEIMATQTNHISGVAQRHNQKGELINGDPSPATAYGVLMGIKAASKIVFGNEDLGGMRIAVQGAGAVGKHLIDHLVDVGAIVTTCDVNEAKVSVFSQTDKVKVVATDEIYDQDVDIFAPCALGAVLNDTTIPRLKAKLVVGAANNQLAEPYHTDLLTQRGITYIPDFVVNAGGVIDIASHREGYSYEAGLKQVEKIYSRVHELILKAKQKNKTPDKIAREEVVSILA